MHMGRLILKHNYNLIYQHLNFLYWTLTFLRTPLHAAACKDGAECISALVEHGANVNEVDSLGQTATILAAMRGHSHSLGMLFMY